MNKFINVINGQISILSYRIAETQATSIAGMLSAIDSETDESLVIPLDGVIDALEDGEFLAQCDVSIAAVEELHDLIKTHQREAAQ